MLQFQDVQREVGQQNANGWEEIWNDLVVVDACRGGVSLDVIHWDCRTSAPDGGRDLIIDRGTTRQGAIFVPNRPSIWSVKSGADGLACKTLRAELDEKSHPKLVAALKDGHTYVYCVCRPAGHDDRSSLRAAADECCVALGIRSDSVKLLFDNHLCEGLKVYPAVLARHCHRLSTMKGQTLDQWSRPRPHFNTNIAYVDIADRRGYIDKLVSHLNSADEVPVLHIAGLSGIGKTRLVFEACRHEHVPKTITYFESYMECMELVKRLAEDTGLSIRFVVDEVSLDQHVELRNKLHGFGDRVRAVSIGPAGMRDHSRDTIMVLPPPETDTGVLAVLKHHAPSTVPSDGLQRIAEQCGHDLRFALLMLDAVQREPDLLVDPGSLVRALSDTMGLYVSVIRLFSGATGLDAAFQDRYPWLTLGAHIGVKPPREAELAFVAGRASCALIDLEKTVAQAINCGLGDRPGHLFEAVPRGMATRVFADVLWPTIEPRFKDLLAAAPNSDFVRSIMKRVEMCPDHVKREVTSRIDSHFRSQLGSPSIASLNDPSTARTLRSWTELSPEAGLPWLRRAIDNATNEELQAFEGSGRLGWGPAGPRRDVVWLLEHLACFAEHFATCEAMLFRLALAENEAIGNNATAIWTEKYRVVLSNTEMPYPDRVKILLARMAEATTGTMRLLTKGFAEAVTSHHSAMAPPATVGGRLVPPEWRPIGLNIYDLFVKTIVEGLQVICTLPQDSQRLARDVIASELMAFYKQDTHAALVEFFRGPLDVDERLKLSAALEDLSKRLQSDSDPKVVALAKQVAEWMEQVAPKDLMHRTQLVVGRPPWFYDKGGDSGRDAWKQPYGAIVRELRQYPCVLRALADWLNKSEGYGKWNLGWMLGAEERSSEFDDVIEGWLKSGRCLEVCCGFLAARRAIEGALAAWASSALDGLIDSEPNLVARITIAVDPTSSGWDRVRRCVERDSSAVAEVLGRMFGNEWEAVLGSSGQAWVLNQLWPEAEPRDEFAGATALHLLGMFRSRHENDPIPIELLPIVRRLVFSPPLRRGHNAHIWKDLALTLAKTEPGPVIAFVAKVALDVRKFDGMGHDVAVCILAELAGAHDKAIIEAILETLTERQDTFVMGVQDLQRLFAAIDSKTVENAVAVRDVSSARAIGQFIPDPGVNEEGTPSLPALTEWYMRTYGDDEECFHQFRTGRWNGRIQMGWAWERQTKVERLAKAYADHPINSLRRWAASLMREHEADVERDRIQFEERKRS